MSTFTLSLEELAMTLALNESHEDATQLLANYYKDISPSPGLPALSALLYAPISETYCSKGTGDPELSFRS